MYEPTLMRKPDSLLRCLLRAFGVATGRFCIARIPAARRFRIAAKKQSLGSRSVVDWRAMIAGDFDFVRRFWGAFNDRDLTGLEHLFTDDYVNHAALPGTAPGPEGQAELMKRLWQAFPDAHFSVEHVARDGDTVMRGHDGRNP
jgi:SnoaL-like protein